MSLRSYLTILLILILTSFEIQAGEFDYYTNNPRAKKEIKVVLKYHWSKAVHAVEALQYKPGISELNYILRYIPNHPHALLLLSKLTVSLNHTSDAKPYFEKAIEFGPQYENTYNVFGIHLFKSGKYKESIEKFNSALAINPDSSEGHYNIGLTYFSLGNYTKAKHHAQLAYNLGYPLPGLKNKLKSVGKWDEKPMPKPE